MLAAFSTGGEMFQNLVGLVPGFGPAIVAVFGIFFWPPLAMIAFSRADFSEATETYLKAIPLGIGKTLSAAFAKTDKFATKFGDKLGLIKEQGQQALGKLKDTLNNAKASNLIDGLRDKAENTIGSKMEDVGSSFNPDQAPPPVETSSRKSFAPMPVRRRGGSKRLSTKKQHKSKIWRKTKRSKSARR
jgi:hypothetical protein